jgi:hypothetical protein
MVSRGAIETRSRQCCRIAQARCPELSIVRSIGPELVPRTSLPRSLAIHLARRPSTAAVAAGLDDALADAVADGTLSTRRSGMGVVGRRTEPMSTVPAPTAASSRSPTSAIRIAETRPSRPATRRPRNGADERRGLLATASVAMATASNGREARAAAPSSRSGSVS